MMKLARTVLTIALAAVMVAPLLAEEGKKKKRKRKGRKARVRNVVRLPRTVRESLSEEQKKKIAAINKKYAPKFAELFKARNEILTPDQRKARREALQAARKAKKKRREAQKAIAEAVNLSEEQKKKQAEVGKKMRALQAQVRKDVNEVLTDDQRKQLRDGRKKKGGKKKRRKKKDAA